MDADRLEDLLAEFWSRREAGEDLDVEAFVAEHRELAERLRPALADLLGADALLPDAGGARGVAPPLPARVGGYRVVGRLGRGAAGEVFAVVDEIGAEFALKRLLPHVAADDRAQQRLLREASVLRELRHPGIVAVVAAARDEHGPFVVMERVDGASLAAWVADARRIGRDAAAARLAGGGTAWQRIARCGAAIADAIAAAHAVGIRHRDLKPGNVLLRADGTPVVVDFGLAVDPSAATLTGTGDVLGTPHYMAPEQARGAPADASCDVYGLGAILYELLTLEPPRAGGDPLQVLAAARSVPPLPPRRRDRSVPRELDLLVRRAMAFRRAHRLASAAELAQALRLVADGGRPVGLTLAVPLRVDEFWRRHRRPVVAAMLLAAATPPLLFYLDARDAARAERLRSAMQAAAEAQLDGDAAATEAAAAVLRADGEPALAAWFVGGDDAAIDDAFVHEMQSGHRSLRRDPKDAAAAFQRAVDLRPGIALPGAWLGVAAAAAGDHATAERELTAAVRALPDSVRLRVELAHTLHRLGKDELAATMLAPAVERPRAGADTWHELAKARAYAKDYDGALQAVDRAIELAGSKRTVSMLRTKAVIFDGMARHADAEPLLRRIVEEAPGPATWHSYGRVLDNLHRIDEAVAAYRHSVELDPKNAASLLSLVYSFSGSNSVECEQCRAFYAAHPTFLDAALVDRYATEMLVAEEGDYAHVEALAGYARRAAAVPLFTAALAERLQRDLPDIALGRLLRAQRKLQGP